MRTLPLVAAWLGLLTLGCRADNSTVLLERDLRLQEDKIYHLESCLDDAQAAREATIRENESLKLELSQASDSGASGTGPADTDFQPPSVELPGANEPARSRERPDLQPPTIELPGAGDVPPAGEATPGKEDTTVVDSPPSQLVINKRLTGGLDRDGHDGDEGLLVVFELRDAAGHLVKWPGKVSVVAMDPALEGPLARIGRWDFASDEVPDHYLNTMFGRGLQFELPWSSNPPAHRDLMLFVRFTSDDGQKLTSDTKITVRPPGAAGGIDRQTKQTSPIEDVESADKREPRSRLKARAPKSDSPRATRAAGDTDSAALEPDAQGESADGDVASEADSIGEPLLQAKRPDRPKWKPFR